MMRVVFLVFVVLLTAFLFLKSGSGNTDSVLPVFLCKDGISEKHHTRIKVASHSIYRPTAEQIRILKNDYSNIWAHLNHLYSTNDVVSGKEYYSEDWFRQICLYYENVKEPLILRRDIQHELHIQNWDRDGLLCTAIDSNVIFKYTYPDKSVKTTKANLAIILLIQGDHWRIAALKIIKESIIETGNLAVTDEFKAKKYQ